MRKLRDKVPSLQSKELALIKSNITHSVQKMISITQTIEELEIEKFQSFLPGR